MDIIHGINHLKQKTALFIIVLHYSHLLAVVLEMMGWLLLVAVEW